MRDAGLQGAMPKKRRVITTDSNHTLSVADNILNREFVADRPNHKWVTDITYIATDEGWLYLATVLDLFNRMIVGWSMSQHIDERLVEAALRMALQRRSVDANLLHHSDRGSQYASGGYQRLLSDWGITVSMSRRGNCYDDAYVIMMPSSKAGIGH